MVPVSLELSEPGEKQSLTAKLTANRANPAGTTTLFLLRTPGSRDFTAPAEKILWPETVEDCFPVQDFTQWLRQLF